MKFYCRHCNTDITNSVLSTKREFCCPNPECNEPLFGLGIYYTSEPIEIKPMMFSGSYKTKTRNSWGWNEMINIYKLVDLYNQHKIDTFTVDIEHDVLRIYIWKTIPNGEKYTANLSITLKELAFSNTGFFERKLNDFLDRVEFESKEKSGESK